MNPCETYSRVVEDPDGIAASLGILTFSIGLIG
jgi:hypothetical protein